MSRFLLFCVLGTHLPLFTANAVADDGGAEPLPTVVVTASRLSQLSVADSANAGTVTRRQLEARSVYRPGELLEATPGLIVSQHSGEGKANQFYLRGFNLDHGTDLRTTIDGMPVNQRSHAHGQGWTDMNFLVPELVERLDYRKGPYYADQGDFAAAGAVQLRHADKLDAGVASAGVGQHGFRRTLLADSPAVGAGHLLYALELFHNDGPFTRGDDYRKLNGVLRYSQGTRSDGFHVEAMAYRGQWNASDQLPQRAVSDGRLGRFDTVDPSDGGSARRYSLSGEWRGSFETGRAQVNAYAIRNQLDLYSNFTYFLNDQLNGDQFSQPDRRLTSGVDAQWQWNDNRLGVQVQHDRIRNGLYDTVARRRRATTREDRIGETSVALFGETTTRWNESFRSVLGLRFDHLRFDVDSNLGANSGRASASRASPSLSLVFGPWQKTELYLNAGRGFHSNDARGATIRVDPKSGDAVDKVTPMAGATGIEAGLRSEWLPGLQSTLSLYRLDVGSELVFVGDAGTTEAGRASRRSGIEFSNYYKPNRWLTVDADLAFAHARFRDAHTSGRRIPGAVEGVASLALAVDHLGPWYGALQWRYFGPRPLIEDNSVRSRATATVNGRIGYKLNARMKLELEGFNLTNRRDSAVDYFYPSRLRGEGAAVEDVHFHPVESRSFRVTLQTSF